LIPAAEMMSPLFAILLPIIRPPVFLPLAIESVLAQSATEFELLVICDGAPPETIACAERYAQRDPRVKVFAHPKGERQGEAYRHRALATSTARLVAHICDDDLWLPNHLAEMETLLSAADFGNVLHVHIHPGDVIEVVPGDLGRPETRRRMRMERFNIFGPTCAGYRMDAYRRLPEGWAPAPPDIWTDLHMWRKFLAMEEFAFATRAAVTALHFATPDRLDVPIEQREKENRGYLERIRDARQRDEIVQAAWRSLHAATQAELDGMVQSRSWRLTAPLRALTARIGRLR
jgi:glycosyltransferase involved in cell wall biosynthesis